METLKAQYVPKKFSIHDAYLFGWNASIGHWKVTILPSAIYLLSDFLLRPLFGNQDLFYVVIAFTLISFYTLGINRVGFAIDRGENPDIKTYTPDSRAIFRILGGMFLYITIVFIGLIFFVIPGVYLAAKYFWALYVLSEKELSVREAFARSAQLSRGIKWKTILLMFSTMIVAYAGVLAFVVGVFLSFSVASLASVRAYRVISKDSTEVAELEPSGAKAL